MITPTLAIVFQTAVEPGPLAVWVDLAVLVIAVAVVAVAIMGGMLMLRFNWILTQLQRSAHQNFGPVSDRARSISDNVEFITQALRTDVEKLNASVRALSDRLQQASDRMEERVEEFNALMEVVQGEAEDLFLDTASTVRGVREGARAITDTSSGDRRRSPGARGQERRSAAPAGHEGGGHRPASGPAGAEEDAVPETDEAKAIRTGED